MMLWTGRTAVVCAGLLLMAATGARGADAVKVEKEEVKVEYKYFDPKHLPDPAPPLEHGESAVTVYSLGIETYVRYGYLQPPPQSRPVKINFSIRDVSVKLKCTITVWLPEDPPARLRAHEEGHREIAETFYKRAEEVARSLARKEVGKTVVGRGEDAQSAGNAAIDKVTERVNGGYTQAIIDPCKKVQIAFDDITDHGRKEIETKEAIKEAMEVLKKK